MLKNVSEDTFLTNPVFTPLKNIYISFLIIHNVMRNKFNLIGRNHELTLIFAIAILN